MRAEAVASSDANLSRARLWLQSASALELVALLVFALGYLLAYGFGNITQAKASPLWFPDSVLLCALLRSPRRKWWIYLAIAVPIRFIPAPYAAVPLWFICATTANDMVKATCAASVRRLPNGSSRPATMSQLATSWAWQFFWFRHFPLLRERPRVICLDRVSGRPGISGFSGNALANVVLARRCCIGVQNVSERQDRVEWS